MAAQNSPILTNNGEQTQAIFGSMRTLNGLLKKAEFLNSRIIIFWDGDSFRKKLDSNYKANRDDNEEAAANRDEYRRQSPAIKKAYYHMGLTQVSASNLEADDLIASTVRLNAGRRRMTVISGDKDLWQLVGPNVNWHNPINFLHGSPSIRTLTDDTFAEATGYRSTRAFMEAKALQGDASDNLPGVGKIGQKTALQIVDHWQSVKAMIEDVRMRRESAIPPHMSRSRKKLIDFASDAGRIDIFEHNVKMMNLIDPIAPEPVNKRIVKGSASREGLIKFCEQHGFVSIIKNIDSWIENFDHEKAA
jgi:5'-3' exonuclease